MLSNRLFFNMSNLFSWATAEKENQSFTKLFFVQTQMVLIILSL